MKKTFVLKAMMFVMLIFALEAGARADDVQITGGSVVYNITNGVTSVSFTGDNLLLRYTVLSGRFACISNCAPGGTTNLNMTTLNPFVTNVTELVYNSVTYSNARVRGDFTFSTPSFTLPAATFDNVTGLLDPPSYGAQTPATLSGALEFDNQQNALLFNLTISGNGIASGVFSQANAFDRNYSISQTTYSIAQPGGPQPVPEPATIVLLGTGFSGILVRYRRRRKG